MSILVLVDGWNPSPWVDALNDALPDETIEAYPDVDDPDAVEYALIWAPPAGSLETFKNLKGLLSLGAGVDHLLRYDNLPDCPIARIVDPDLTSRMTEWVVLQVLLHHRFQPAYDQLKREGKWRELRQPAAHEVTVGMMGLGELGRDAASVLNRIGFRLTGWSRTAKTISHIDCYHDYDGARGLDAFLSQTDILVCLLPLTAETEGLVDYEVLSRLRPDGPLRGPVFVNAGRGKIQKEVDLVRALQDGTLKAASLDVFEKEPLPGESSLWGLDNVVITPHVAAVSNPPALSRLIARQIQAHRAGRDMEHLVDPNRGY